MLRTGFKPRLIRPFGKRAKAFLALASVVAGAAILASRSPSPGSAVDTGSRRPVVLWAWERPEMLGFIDPDKVEVAVLAGTLILT